MPAAETLKLLEDNVASEIKGFNSGRKFYRSANYYLTMGTAVLSASTTVLIGAKEIMGFSWLTVLSLICSAGVTIVAAYNGFLRPRELWVSTSSTLMSLYRLRAAIEYAKTKAPGPLSQEEVDAFQQAFQAIVDKANESWASARQMEGSRD